MIISWFSAGVTSAVATHLAIEKYEDVKIIYFETGNHHADNERFIADCEKWYGQEIEIIQNPNHEDIYSVFRKRKFLNSPYGAPCTLELKKDMRRKIESENTFTHQVFGFEDEKRERMRALRFSKDYPHTRAIYPLIDEGLNKLDCIKILNNEGIEVPKMYKLGYSNNNCVGCVKGGMGYFNKIRIDFPEIFERLAKLERELNATCLNGQFLDELDPNRGRMSKPLVQDCGIFCEENYA